MNREIKFRGKLIGIEGWVYGYYVKDPKGKHRIYWQPFSESTSNTYHFVEESTVGQYTGLKDKNGVEIYEGDLLHRHLDIYWKVVFEDSCWIAKTLKPSGLYLSGSQFIETEFIGNIHENPELIK